MPAPVLEVHDGFWWTVMGEQSAAVANFGPALETAEGRFRQWCLVVHLPGGTEPLSCVQGLVRLADSSPILAEGGTFRVELRPCDGCDWGAVTDDARIVAKVEGIY